MGIRAETDRREDRVSGDGSHLALLIFREGTSRVVNVPHDSAMGGMPESVTSGTNAETRAVNGARDSISNWLSPHRMSTLQMQGCSLQASNPHLCRPGELTSSHLELDKLQDGDGCTMTQ